jgi:hypothetical protein
VIDRTRTIGAVVTLLTASILAVSLSGGTAVSFSMQTTASTPEVCPSPSGSPAATPSSEGSPLASPSPAGSPFASPEASCASLVSVEPPAECVASADGIVLPVASNPIANPSTSPGLAIAEVLVENNVDPATGGDAPDHLEIALRNESRSELSGFVVYYEITDLVTGAKEGYCSALLGFTIPAGGERVVHFDSTGATDHYLDNEFSLYHASLNEMQVDVTVSATGVAPQTASVKKDAGGDEDPND